VHVDAGGVEAEVVDRGAAARDGVNGTFVGPPAAPSPCGDGAITGRLSS
jgi:hypothetical protein